MAFHAVSEAGLSRTGCLCYICLAVQKASRLTVKMMFRPRVVLSVKRMLVTIFVRSKNFQLKPLFPFWLIVRSPCCTDSWPWPHVQPLVCYLKTQLHVLTQSRNRFYIAIPLFLWAPFIIQSIGVLLLMTGTIKSQWHTHLLKKSNSIHILWSNWSISPVYCRQKVSMYLAKDLVLYR